MYLAMVPPAAISCASADSGGLVGSPLHSADGRAREVLPGQCAGPRANRPGVARGSGPAADLLMAKESSARTCLCRHAWKLGPMDGCGPAPSLRPASVRTNSERDAMANAFAECAVVMATEHPDLGTLPALQYSLCNRADCAESSFVLQPGPGDLTLRRVRGRFGRLHAAWASR